MCAAGVCLLVSCGSTPGANDDTGVVPVTLPHQVASDAPVAVAGASVAQLGFRLLDAAGAAATPDANVVLSPLSIAVTLGMLEPGASGDGTAALRELLAIEDAPAWHRSMSALTQDLERRRPAPPDDNFALPGEEQDPGQLGIAIANGAFVQPGYQFDPAYLTAVGTDYDATIEQLDFAADPEAAADRINEFVADGTEGRITDLIDPTSIDPLTVLGLVNALMLASSWEMPFDAALTADGTFTLADGSTVSVPMMHGSSSASAAGDGWIGATKRLVGGITLQVVLPDVGRFDEIARRFEEVGDEFVANRTDGAALVMPRFDTRVTTGLTELFPALGLEPLRTPGNLLGIAGDDGLIVDTAVHQTWLSIDESGFEAAAATLILVVAASGPVLPPVPVVLDRPFLLRIADDYSGATLFIGRIGDPTA